MSNCCCTKKNDCSEVFETAVKSEIESSETIKVEEVDFDFEKLIASVAAQQREIAERVSREAKENLLKPEVKVL